MGRERERLLEGQCEDWMRQGQAARVSRALHELSPATLSRAGKLAFANLARRVDEIDLGLRLLTPLVRARALGFAEDASEAELAEYAMLIYKIGSSAEALRILERLGAEPRSLLYRALVHLGRWEYAAAQRPLREFLAVEGLEPYQRALGLLNLAATHVFLVETKEAESLLEEVQRECAVRGFRRLEANGLELLAQIELQRRNYARSEELLHSSLAMLGEEHTSESLYAEKWRCLVALLRDHDAEPLRRFQKRAMAGSFWEGARDADFHLAKATGDEALFQRLYLGTPFAAYREHLLDNFPFPAPARVEIGNGEHSLDLATGEVDGALHAELKPGKAVHRLLATLFSDLYRPVPLGMLFEELFPGEGFHIHSSPNRIHQVVRRARRALTRLGLPVELRAEAGAYRALPGKNCRILLAAAPANPGAAHLVRLERCFGNRCFTAREAGELLGLPASSLARVLRAAVDQGVFLREGTGKATRYVRAGAGSKLRTAA